MKKLLLLTALVACGAYASEAVTHVNAGYCDSHIGLEAYPPKIKSELYEWRCKIGKKYDIDDKLVDMVFSVHPEFNVITQSHEFTKSKNNDYLKLNTILLTGKSGQGKTLVAKAIAKKLNADLSDVHISAFECWLDMDIEAQLKKQSEISNNLHRQHVIVVDFAESLCHHPTFGECALTRLMHFIDDCDDENVIFIITGSAEELPSVLKSKIHDHYDVLNKAHLTVRHRKKILQAFLTVKTEAGALEHAAQNTSDMDIRELKYIAQQATFYASLRNAEEISKEDFDNAIRVSC